MILSSNLLFDHLSSGDLLLSHAKMPSITKSKQSHYVVQLSNCIG